MVDISKASIQVLNEAQLTAIPVRRTRSQFPVQRGVSLFISRQKRTIGRGHNEIDPVECLESRLDHFSGKCGAVTSDDDHPVVAEGGQVIGDDAGESCAE